MLLKLTVTGAPARTEIVLMLNARFCAVRLAVFEAGEAVALAVAIAVAVALAVAVAEGEADGDADAVADGLGEADAVTAGVPVAGVI